jgi:hypothetical protein
MALIPAFPIARVIHAAGLSSPPVARRSRRSGRPARETAHIGDRAALQRAALRFSHDPARSHSARWLKGRLVLRRGSRQAPDANAKRTTSGPNLARAARFACLGLSASRAGTDTLA